MFRNFIVVATVALAASLTACGSDPNDALSTATTITQPPQPASAVTYPTNGTEKGIIALDNNFLPGNLGVVAGTKVVFTNNGRNPHNIVPAGDPEATTWGALDSAFQPKATYGRVFDRPGTYVYYCTIHGSPKAGMFATITVTTP